MSENIKQLKAELHAFKKNNEELIQRHNAAISSWDEERERALREGNRVLEWQGKYEQLERENARLQMELNASREAEDFREEQNRQLRNEFFGTKRRILETVTNDKMSDKAKVLDIQFVLRKEAQP